MNFLLCSQTISQFLPYLLLLPREAGKFGELSFDTWINSNLQIEVHKVWGFGISRRRNWGVFWWFFSFQVFCNEASMISLNDLYSSQALCIFRTLQSLSKTINMQNFMKHVSSCCLLVIVSEGKSQHSQVKTILSSS